MNVCFLSGNIIEDVKFKFYIGNKKCSVAKTKIKLENGSSIEIKGYDEMADWMYKNILENDRVCIQGKLDTKMQVEIEYIKNFGGINVIYTT